MRQHLIRLLTAALILIIWVGAAAAVSSSCRLSGQTCIEGGGSRSVGGASVYQDCWRTRYTYSCGGPGYSDYCAGLRGACAGNGSSCSSMGADGVCDEYTETYTCGSPQGGSVTLINTSYTIVRDELVNGCSSHETSCTKIGEVCTEGAGTRNIGGKDVWKDCWAWRRDYMCANPSPYDNCTAYANAPGCTSGGTSCVSQYPDGSCQQYSTTYNCPDQVAGAGTLNQTVYRVVSDTNVAACESQQSRSSCVQGGDTCAEGAGTRNIGGMDVYRDCWAWNRAYTCANPDYRDDCTPYRNGCAQVASLGCTQTYANGSCATTSYEYRCEDPVSGNGTITGYGYDVIRDQVVSGCTAQTGNNTCGLSSETCSEGAGTRNINGMNVYRDCWKWNRIYTCANPSPFDNCTAYAASGCSNRGNRCTGTAFDGSCSVYTHNYRCSDVVNGAGGRVGTEYTVIKDEVVSGCTSQTSRGCGLQSERCTEGPQTRTINGGPVYRDCWAWSRVYSCPNPGYYDDCSAYNGRCTETATSCNRTFFDGSCDLTTADWRCPDPVAGGGTHTGTIYTVTRDEVINDCSAYTDGNICGQPPTTRCIEGAETRVVNGLPVHKSCWKWERSYQCQGSVTNDCAILEANCVFENKTCIQSDAYGRCKNYERTYRCGGQGAPDGQNPPILQCGETVYCINGECDSITREPNDDFAMALTWLNLQRDFSKDFDPATNQVFKGDSHKCRKQFTGVLNCCKEESGWGTDIGLASCNTEEKELWVKQDDKRTVYIGTYCASSFLGVCLEKKRTYCGFDSRLARIVHEQGRSQLHISWGTPKDPDCRGLTINELQAVDWSRIDLREFYPQIYEQTQLPNVSASQQNLQQRIQNFYASQPSPGN